MLKDIIVVSLALAVFYILMFKVPIEDVFGGTMSITEIAHRDLSRVGTYDAKYSISMTIYIGQVLVQSRNVLGDVSPITLLKKWNKNCNYDPEHITELAITAAYDSYCAELDAAQKEKREPNWHIDTNYDLSELPATFKYNDYCNTRSLLLTVYNIMKGNLDYEPNMELG